MLDPTSMFFFEFFLLKMTYLLHAYLNSTCSLKYLLCGAHLTGIAYLFLHCLNNASAHILPLSYILLFVGLVLTYSWLASQDTDRVFLWNASEHITSFIWNQIAFSNIERLQLN